jgi:spoIIIJ-associated protein
MILRELEARGRSVEEATAFAVARLGLPPGKVAVLVLDHGAKGFLGLGQRDAVVRARPDLTPAELVETVLASVLAAGGFAVSVSAKATAEGVAAEVRGEELGELIGRHGRTLDALQYLLNVICARVPGGPRQVTVDVGGYRERREAAVRQQAWRAAESARLGGRRVALQAMPAHERRLAHLTLQDAADVTTESEGEEPYRRVVVVPRRRE